MIKKTNRKTIERENIDCLQNEGMTVLIVGRYFCEKKRFIQNKLLSSEPNKPDRKTKILPVLPINILIMILDKKYPQEMTIRIVLLCLKLC